MLQSSFGNPRVALKVLSTYDLLYSSGVIWADKTACIIDLTVKSRLLRKLSLVRRPEGFGKTSFLAILEFFYDCKHFTTPISDTVLKSTHVFDVDPNAPLMVFPHCDLVLTLDLSVPLTKDFPQERFLVGPLSSFLRDLRPGLIMGTGDESDPRMSPYHSRPSVWESIATELAVHEMLEVAFGFMPDEVRELAREFKVQGVESGLEARLFGSGLEKVYSMRAVLEEIGRQCREQGTEVL